MIGVVGKDSLHFDAFANDMNRVCVCEPFLHREWCQQVVLLRFNSVQGAQGHSGGLRQRRPFQFAVQTYLPVMHLGAVVEAGGHKPIHIYLYILKLFRHTIADLGLLDLTSNLVIPLQTSATWI